MAAPGRIDRLEVMNFKSYKGPQTIGPFRGGFSAIIGPNGAGKSNVLDALCFVLGLAARHLRGSALKDLVYRGDADDATARRAYVRLVYTVGEGELEELDQNEDGEVVFQRSISTTGVTTYSINSKAVQLAEYNKRLEDISVITKARNFLVFQGDVETMANKKPKELMDHVELISNSAECKQECDEKERELQDANESAMLSLTKLRQLRLERKHVREEAQEAEAYERKRRERDELRVQAALLELHTLQRKIEEATAKVAELQGSVKEHREKTVELGAELKQASLGARQRKKACTKLEQQSTTLKQRLQAAQNAAEQARQEVGVAQRRKAALAKQRRHAQQRSDGNQAEMDELERDIGITRESMAKLDKEEEEAANGEDEPTVRLSASQKREYDTLKASARAATASQRAEAEALTRDSERVEAQLKEFRSQRDALQNVMATTRQQLEGAQTRLDTARTAIARSNEQMAELTARRDELQQQIAAASGRQLTLADDLQEVRSRLEEARSSKDLSDHQRRIAQAVSNLQRLFDGVHGQLRQLVRPAASRYGTAITVGLGRFGRAIVVDRAEVARECIAHLQESEIPPQLFLPLDSLDMHDDAGHAGGDYGSMFRSLRDVLQFDERIERAVLYACGSAVVADTLDDAMQLRYSRGQRVKVIALDGTVISRDGNMSGGVAEARDTGAVFDPKEERELMGRRDTLLQDEERLRRQIGSAGQNGGGALHEELRRVEGGLQSLTAKSGIIKGSLTAAERDEKARRAEFNKAQQAVQALTPELERLVADAERVGAELDAAQERLQEAEDEQMAAFCSKVGVGSVRELESGVMARERQRAKKRAELDALLDRQQQQLEYLQSRAANPASQQLAAEAEDVEKALKAAHAAVDKAEAKVEDWRGKLTEKQAALEEAVDAGRLHKDELEKTRRERRAADGALRAAEKGLAQHSDELTHQRAARHEFIRMLQTKQVELPLRGSRRKGSRRRSRRRAAAAAGAGSDEDDDDDEEEADDDDEEDDGDEEMGEESARSSVSGSAAFASDGSRVAADEATADQIDLSLLEEQYTKGEPRQVKQQLEERAEKIDGELERLQPNMKATDELAAVQAKLKEQQAEAEGLKEAAEAARAAFESIRDERRSRFFICYEHLRRVIDPIYKNLTKSSKHRMGGTARLYLYDEEDPFHGDGIRYVAQPPGKRFREMEQLSGGERSVAALALIFALHSFVPSPFFVMDEIDAALDNINVNKVSQYIVAQSQHSNPAHRTQFLVISLKDTFYGKADSVVGIHRDVEDECSKTLTLDLSGYPHRKRSGAAAGGGGGGGPPSAVSTSKQSRLSIDPKSTTRSARASAGSRKGAAGRRVTGGKRRVVRSLHDGEQEGKRGDDDDDDDDDDAAVAAEQEGKDEEEEEEEEEKEGAKAPARSSRGRRSPSKRSRRR